MRDGLLEITDCIEDIFASLFVMGWTSMLHNAMNAFFFPFTAWPASMANASNFLMQNLEWVINSNYQARVNLNFIQFNYMNVGGYKYICSRNVNIT